MVGFCLRQTSLTLNSLVQVLERSRNFNSSFKRSVKSVLARIKSTIKITTQYYIAVIVFGTMSPEGINALEGHMIRLRN